MGKRGRPAKLSWEQVRAIRAALAQDPRPRGLPAELARQYGVTPGAIYAIDKRRIYADEPTEAPSTPTVQ